MDEENIIKVRKIVCEQLRQKAKIKGFTQSKISELTGINQQNISRCFAGEITPTLDTLIKISNAIDCLIKIE